MTAILHTPDEWCHIVGVQILDPDGWRTPYSPTWRLPIDREEFIWRAGMCTARDVRPLTLWAVAQGAQS